MYLIVKFIVKKWLENVFVVIGVNVCDIRKLIEIIYLILYFILLMFLKFFVGKNDLSWLIFVFLWCDIFLDFYFVLIINW